jgi:hypothetical protein
LPPPPPHYYYHFILVSPIINIITFIYSTFNNKITNIY